MAQLTAGTETGTLDRPSQGHSPKKYV